MYICICDCLSKSHMMCITDTLNIYPSLWYQILNFKWSAFLESILPILQNHKWKNGTNGRHQLGEGDLGLLLLTLWPTLVRHWLLCGHQLLMGYPKWGFATSYPTPSISYTDIRKKWLKCHEI